MTNTGVMWCHTDLHTGVMVVPHCHVLAKLLMSKYKITDIINIHILI